MGSRRAGVCGARLLLRTPAPRAPPRPSTAAYARDETDEFLQPTVIIENGEPVGPIRDGDAVVFFNFRADRARQITRAFTEADFAEFPRPKPPQLHFVCFTTYKKEFGLPVAFPPQAADAHPRRRVGGIERHEPPPRRDREVRARHVLLQRRRREALSRRGAHPRPVVEGRHLRPPPGDERRGRHRGSRRGAPRRALPAPTSSTSPTPTWSATRASSPRRSPPSRRSTGASESSKRHAARPACCS